jgi:hypothetical protein
MWLFTSTSMLFIRQKPGAASSNAQRMHHGLFRKNTSIIIEESLLLKNVHNSMQILTNSHLYEDVAHLNVLEHVWDAALAYCPLCFCVGDSIEKPQIAECCKVFPEFLQRKSIGKVDEGNICESILNGSPSP